MKKKISRYRTLIIFGIVFTILLSGIFYWVYRGILKNAGLLEGKEETVIFDKHYVMIVDGSYADYWNDVYTVASEAAAENNAYIELKMRDMDSDYTMSDLMNKSIYSKVDGIILQYTGESGLDTKIDEAAKEGIPVVTLLNDAPETGRISYVGINAYSLGQIYSDFFAGIFTGDDRSDNIVFFITDSDPSRNQQQIFNQARAGILSRVPAGGHISISSVEVPADQLFSASEVIRSNFKYSEKCPDYVVCFDTATTDIVYQALLDYNLLGDVKVLGYYTSDTIVKGIEDENVIATLMLDTHDMGRYAVEALVDYGTDGYNNAYYTIPSKLVKKGDTGIAQE
ncbi:MAG: substrate-binding domain-containing protein [Lachnospiraceae bacterium]|nr:substrate-binding domain-containing protein [Lachnospiraceae bacterium]